MPATTCAFVTTRPGRATQPEPSTPSPHAIPVTRTTLFDARIDVRIRRERRVRAGHDRRRAEKHAERVDALELLEQPLRRELVVEVRRGSSSAAPTGAGRTARGGRGARRRRPSRGARPPRGRGRARRASRGSACRGSRRCSSAGARATSSATPRISAPPTSAPAERDERDVRRRVAEDLRSDPRSEVRTEREPGERERSAQESGRRARRERRRR